MPLATFLSRAVDTANDDLPKPKGSKTSSDDLFNAVLGLQAVPTTSRGTYLPQIDALPVAGLGRSSRPGRAQSSKKPDIIDILSGSAQMRPKRAMTPAGMGLLVNPRGESITTTGGATNVFTLVVPPEEEKRARVFLERVKSVLQVEPGRLVL